MDFVNYIQGEGRHSINLLLAIYALSQNVEQHGKKGISVGEIKQWLRRELQTSMSDLTYRRRRDELVKLGLLELVKTERRFQYAVALTPKGEAYAKLLFEFVEKAKQLEAATDNQKTLIT